MAFVACTAISETTRGEVPAWLRDTARRRNFTLGEKRKVDGWVGQQVQTLTTSNDANTPVRFRQDFAQFSGSQPSAEVTEAFRSLLAEKCSARFSAALDQANSAQALEMAIALAELGSATAIEGLSACLKHSNGGIRYWGAKGLRQSRRHWDKNPAAAQQAVEAIVDAAGRETNEIIVGKIFAALDYGTNPGIAPKAVVAELIKVVNKTMPARIEAYRTGKIRRIASDREWPRILVGLWLSKHTPAAEKPVVLGHVSRLLVAATKLYMDGERHYRGNRKPPPLDPGSEMLLYRPKGVKGNIGASGMPPSTTLTDVVAACEAALRRAISKSEQGGSMPRVHELLMVDRPKELEESKINLQLNEWVGTATAAGVLNKSPLNVKVPPPFEIERAAPPPAARPQP